MKVVIANTTLLNAGDAAINEATMQILRHSFGGEVDFACYEANPAVAARYHPTLALRAALFDQVASRLRWRFARLPALLWVLAVARLARVWDVALLALPAGLRHSLAEYRAADVVVSAGGTYLVDRYRIAPRIFDFLVVLALGRPLVLFTQSIGPLAPGRDRFLLRFALRRAALVMVRDRPSEALVAELGVPPARIARCPDAVFALSQPHEQVSDAPRINPPRIAVSVRDWPFFAGGRTEEGMERYLDAVAAFVRRVVETDGARVTMVSTCQGVPEYWTDDSKVAARVVERLPAATRDSVTLDGRFRSPAALIDYLRGFDLIVATRMHAGILALCAGVPVVPIAYEFKTRELFTELEAEALLCDVETVTAGRLYRACRRALGQTRYGRAAAHWRRVALARCQAMASGRLVAAAVYGEGRT